VTRHTTFQAGDTTATICRYGDTVAMSFCSVGLPKREVSLSIEHAAEFARALLRIAGEELPKSRQIGGIIGPY